MVHTWLDRPLSLAGRVIVQNAQGDLETKFFKHDKPICQIPNLAIHLRIDRSAFRWDTDTTFRPILATKIVDDLYNEDSEPGPDSLYDKKEPLKVHGPFSTSI